MMARPRISSSSGPAGFTLIEVVVALSVGALIALAAHSGLVTLSELSLRAEDLRSETLNAAAVRRQLRDWLRTSSLNERPSAPEFAGVPRVDATGMRNDSLAVPIWSNSQTASPTAGDAMMELFVEKVSDAPGGVLVAAFASLSGDPPPAGGAADPRNAGVRRVVLMPSGVEGFSVRYLLVSGTEQSWLPAWRSRHRLPDAIEVQIFGDSLPRLLRLPLIVPLVTGG